MQRQALQPPKLVKRAFKVELQKLETGDVVLYFHEPIGQAERGLVGEALARGLRLAQGLRLYQARWGSLPEPLDDLRTNPEPADTGCACRLIGPILDETVTMNRETVGRTR